MEAVAKDWLDSRMTPMACLRAVWSSPPLLAMKAYPDRAVLPGSLLTARQYPVQSQAPVSWVSLTEQGSGENAPRFRADVLPTFAARGLSVPAW